MTETEMKEKGSNVPLTFTEQSYWWLWIPLVSWVPFCIPLILPLGPLMVGFSFSNKMRFVWETAAHNGESLPDSIGTFIGQVYTLGYNTVHRSYKAAKHMLKEETGRDDEPIPGWNPLLLLFYILCPALVYMPLIRVMCKHREWHQLQVQATEQKAPNY